MSITDSPLFRCIGSVAPAFDAAGTDEAVATVALELSPADGPHATGSAVTFLAQFRTAAGADFDPARVIFRAGASDGAVSVLEYGVSGAVTRTAAGRYSCAFTPAIAHLHRVRVSGTGANACAAEAQFSVS